MKIWFSLLTFLGLLVLAILVHAESSQRAYLIWDDINSRTCPVKVELTGKSYLQAPMKEDGTPDLTKLELVHPFITFNPACGGRIEVRRETVKN